MKLFRQTVTELDLEHFTLWSAMDPMQCSIEPKTQRNRDTDVMSRLSMAILPGMSRSTSWPLRTGTQTVNSTEMLSDFLVL